MFNMKMPKMPKMPKVKMRDVVGKTKSLGNGITKGVGNATKGAVNGIKSLNPFKK